MTTQETIQLRGLSTAEKCLLSADHNKFGHYDSGILRSFIAPEDNQAYVTLNSGTPQEKTVRVDNAALRKDEWILLDDAVLQAARLRTPGVLDLMARGLTLPISGMDFTVFESENISEITAASVSMTGFSQSEKDTVDHGLVGIPLPIVFKDWDISLRGLRSSRNKGQPLDVSNGEAMGFVVGEQIENMFVNGYSALNFGGYDMPGITTFTSRNTGTLTASWTTATGEQIVDDVNDMIQDSHDARHHGPWVLYIPSTYESAMNQDYKAAVSGTVRQRIMDLEGIQAIIILDFLATDNVVLMQTTSTVARVLDGMAPTTMQWDSEGGLKFNMKTMGIRPVQLRADYNGNCGITHYTTA